MQYSEHELWHLNVISYIERTGSSLSLLGCIFILLTFCFSGDLRKPINRLVFYASWGNLFSVVGTLMSRKPLANVNSFGCQLQAFLIQMFMPADAFWILAMAVNVYLTFYFKYDAEKLRRMEIWYLLLCYGVPLIPALSFIFISTPSRGRMFGDATLWCWVTSEWEVFRIATFYGPVWVAIICTFFIYIRAGGDIYKKRKQLRNFSSSNDRRPPTQDPHLATKTMEVTVTSEVAEDGGMQPNRLPDRIVSARPSIEEPDPIYSVTITSDAKAAHVAYEEPPTPATASRREEHRTQRKANMDINTAVWNYTKCAILFFTALLVTWIPSSANRVYSVIYPDRFSWPLEYLSATVLPLQGFWNCLIYITTSWTAVRLIFSDLRSWRLESPWPSWSSRRRHSAFMGEFQRSRSRSRHRLGHRYFGSESVTELAAPNAAISGDSWGDGIDVKTSVSSQGASK